MKIITKLKTFFLLLLMLFAFASYSGEIILKGIYKGENIYVENPYSSVGVGFCVSEVLVNDFTTTDEINSSFFEIDLSIYGFKFGDFVKITIRHKEDCVPRVLNEEVLIPFSTFNVQSISVDKDGFIEWTTTNEHGSIPFVVEQYRWNKWINTGTVQGKGTGKLNKYSSAVNLHSGVNKFRIKQIGSKQNPRYSNTVEFDNNISEITFIPGNGGKVNDKIFFSSFTQYEIYDYYGKSVTSGAAHDVDVSGFKAGTYFLNYDNKTETFIKK